MPEYCIEYHPRTKSQLEIIPKKFRNQIFDRIDKLAKDPRPIGVEPLQGNEKGLMRIRQGDYRIVYNLEDHKLLILIVRVVARKEVYTKKHSR